MELKHILVASAVLVASITQAVPLDIPRAEATQAGAQLQTRTLGKLVEDAADVAGTSFRTDVATRKYEKHAFKYVDPYDPAWGLESPTITSTPLEPFKWRTNSQGAQNVLKPKARVVSYRSPWQNLVSMLQQQAKLRSHDVEFREALQRFYAVRSRLKKRTKQFNSMKLKVSAESTSKRPSEQA